MTILTFFCSLSVLATNYQIDTICINSKILNETRTILIFKPIGIQKTDSVSLIYMLDGERAKQRLNKIADGQFKIPLIAIGIVNTNRSRDMLPVNEPEKFLDFIESELIPRIEIDYSINQRILFGHSFAGGFTIYSMISKVGLFDKYLASSPTPIMKMVDPLIYKQLDEKLRKNIEFFFSYGSNDMKQVKKWAGKLNKNLSGLTLMHINWRNEIYKGENHNSSDKISIIEGLKY